VVSGYRQAESPTIRLVVVALGGTLVLAVVSIVFLAWNGSEIPDALNTIGSGAAGALATLLTTFTPSPIPGGRRLTDAVPAVPGDTVEGAPATITMTGPSTPPIS
jgi:hypothetical protein